MRDKSHKKTSRTALAMLLCLLLCATSLPGEGARADSVFSQRADTHAAIEAQLSAELASGAYGPDTPLVILNPYGESPLTALILLTTPAPTRADVTIVGKDAYTTLSHSFDTLTQTHALPIYGLYPDSDNTIRIGLTDEAGERSKTTVSLRTEPLPEGFSKTDVRVSRKESMAEGFTFIDCPHLNGNYPLAIDANGDVRWYLSDKSLNGSMAMAYLANGNLIVSSGQVIPGTYNNLSSAYEITPLGRFVRAYDIHGIHHNIREKANGNLLIAASMEGRESQNDYIVEINRETGNVVNSWDLMEILPMDVYDTRPPYTGNLSNWLHNNGFSYLEDEDAFIISGRHQNMIARFTGADGQLQWVLSATVGELNPDMHSYLLAPVGEPFEYPTSQHSPIVLPDGRLMLFDNRNFMDPPAEGAALDQSLLYSRAVLYEIDEDAMTVREDWAYGQDRTDLYSSFVSSVSYLGNAHFLIDFGGLYVAEDGTHYDHMYTPADIKNTSRRTSVIVELLHDEIVFEAELYGNANSNSSAAERHSIYSNAQEPAFAN